MNTDPRPAPPPAPTPASADTAAIAREVSLRIEQWFQTHRLALAPEAQAEFVEMGVEAVVRHPERPRGEVLDELIGELDQRLGLIVDEAADRHEQSRDRARAAPRRGWLRRMFGRGG